MQAEMYSSVRGTLSQKILPCPLLQAAAITSTRVSRTWVVACHPKGLFLTLKANSDPRFGISIPLITLGHHPQD